MLDDSFKNSRKFLGVPLAILVVVVIALVTGGTVLGAYLAHTATVEVTVLEPLRFTFDDNFDQNTHSWEVQLYACESATAYVSVANLGSEDVPVTAVVTPDSLVEGVTCTVIDMGSQSPLTVVPSGQTLTVAVTIAVACDTPTPDGILDQTWTVEFFRG